MTADLRGVTFSVTRACSLEERGIMTGGGPLIAWFTVPPGNVFSVMQQD